MRCVSSTTVIRARSLLLPAVPDRRGPSPGPSQTAGSASRASSRAGRPSGSFRHPQRRLSGHSAGWSGWCWPPPKAPQRAAQSPSRAALRRGHAPTGPRPHARTSGPADLTACPEDSRSRGNNCSSYGTPRATAAGSSLGARGGCSAVPPDRRVLSHQENVGERRPARTRVQVCGGEREPSRKTIQGRPDRNTISTQLPSGRGDAGMPAVPDRPLPRQPRPCSGASVFGQGPSCRRKCTISLNDANMIGSRK